MKLLTLVTILLFQVPLFAQLSTESKANVRFIQHQVRSAPLRAKDQITDNEIATNKLAKTYQNATAEQKVSIQKQIKDLLYKTLELKIQVKEQQVTFMMNELNSLREQQAVQDIERIETDLESIKKDISNRKNNRDKIVALRLKALLKL